MTQVRNNLGKNINNLKLSIDVTLTSFYMG